MKLNLCCGTNLFPNWLNVDKTDVEQDYLRHLRDAPPGFVWPAAQQPIADAVLAGKLEFIQYDVRRGLLLWEDASVDAIYIGQAIEHFNRGTEAPALLRECCRVLKQYGVIKLTTPDLHKLLVDRSSSEDDGYPYEGAWEGLLERYESEQPAFYKGALPEDQFSYLAFGAMGPGSTNENYEGHHHLYTERSLGALLGQCGFDVRSKDSVEFADTLDMGMSHSFSLEGVKP